MRKGFTLLEMLVVISIIGVLAALVVPNFNVARERARDVQRKNDVKQIQKALELYRQDSTTGVFPTAPVMNGSILVNVNYCWFPAVVGVYTGSTCGNNIPYMNKIPGDPLSQASAVIPYIYSVNGTGTSYTLCACLENKTDTEGVATGTCGAPGGSPGSSITCSSSIHYELNSP